MPILKWTKKAAFAFRAVNRPTSELGSSYPVTQNGRAASRVIAQVASYEIRRKVNKQSRAKSTKKKGIAE